MGTNINVTFPDLIATEELIIEYHKKGYSITRIAENIDAPIGKVMDVLSRLNEESGIDKTLDEIETSS
jgi:hypothetical protein